MKYLFSAEAENEAETAVFVAGATDAESTDFGSVPHMVASAQAVVVVAHAHHTHHIGGSIGQSLQVEAVGSLLLGDEAERDGHIGGNHLVDARLNGSHFLGSECAREIVIEFRLGALHMCAHGTAAAKHLHHCAV